MTKKTFEELQEVDSLVADLYTKNPALKAGKFAYAYTKFAKKNLYPRFEEYNEALTDAWIDFAMVDEKTKAILTDPNPRGFKYDKDGLKNVILAERRIRKEWMVKEFEVEPYFCNPENIPAELVDETKEALTGLVIE